MVTALNALARLTVKAVELTADMSETAVLLLSLIVQNGVVLYCPAPVVAKLSVMDDTEELDTIDPRALVELAVIDAHPVPQVGAVPVKAVTPLMVRADEPIGVVVPIPTEPPSGFNDKG